MSEGSTARRTRRPPRRDRQRSREESELREFLEGDERSPDVDPVFRERLREELWALLEERRRKRGSR